MNRLLLIAIAAVLSVIGVVGALLYHQPLEPAPTAAVTDPATGAPTGRFVPMEGDFNRVAPVDGAGQPADMAPYRGKALLVNLWATWCAPCIEELPSLGELQRELGGENFQVVTIAIDERDLSKIEPFLEKHGAGELPALIDRDRTIDTVAKIIALPTSLLVARDGTVKAKLTGDARWHCGKALEAVKAFIADGTVMEDELEKCE
ncbi:redoxin domain-containing protein [Dongia deserti]|uniref:redoxin domain-containing protein n=1 Tax=Dongia deserti TaxID=2268030 RepID=UPI000E652618|nr:redoxin domain-containing protein [Dongia deserti]